MSSFTTRDGELWAERIVREYMASKRAEPPPPPPPPPLGETHMIAATMTPAEMASAVQTATDILNRCMQAAVKDNPYRGVLVRSAHLFGRVVIQYLDALALLLDVAARANSSPLSDAPPAEGVQDDR